MKRCSHEGKGLLGFYLTLMPTNDKCMTNQKEADMCVFSLYFSLISLPREGPGHFYLWTFTFPEVDWILAKRLVLLQSVTETTLRILYALNQMLRMKRSFKERSVFSFRENSP